MAKNNETQSTKKPAKKAEESTSDIFGLKDNLIFKKNNEAEKSLTLMETWGRK